MTTLIQQLQEQARKNSPIEGILNQVCETTSTTKEQIRCESRYQPYADARRLFAYFARINGYYFREIGEHINRHHSTAIHYLQDVESLVKHNDEFRELFEKIKNKEHGR